MVLSSDLRRNREGFQRDICCNYLICNSFYLSGGISDVSAQGYFRNFRLFGERADGLPCEVSILVVLDLLRSQLCFAAHGLFYG